MVIYITHSQERFHNLKRTGKPGLLASSHLKTDFLHTVFSWFVFPLTPTLVILPSLQHRSYRSSSNEAGSRPKKDSQGLYFLSHQSIVKITSHTTYTLRCNSLVDFLLQPLHLFFHFYTSSSTVPPLHLFLHLYTSSSPSSPLISLSLRHWSYRFLLLSKLDHNPRKAHKDFAPFHITQPL